jgi:hypothetical protein
VRERAPEITAELAARVIAGAPTVAEAERRRAVLEKIRRRQATDGCREAVADASRCAQFAPFDALEGFREMVTEVRERSRGGPRA